MEKSNSSSGPLAKFVQRPGYGVAGHHLAVYANYFPIKFNSNKSVYHYDVEIEPIFEGDYLASEMDKITIDTGKPKRYRKMDKKINRLVLEEAVKINSHEPDQIFYGCFPVYDGEKNLYTTKDLFGHQAAGHPSNRLLIDFFEEDGRERKYALRIKLASRIQMKHLQDYFDGLRVDIPLQVMQVINIVLRHGPTLYNVPIGSSLYKSGSQGRQDIGGGRQLAYGFFQSVRTGTSIVSLVIDRTATAFYSSSKLPPFIAAILRLSKDQFLAKKTFTDSERKRIMNELLGKMVFVDHLTYKRKYKVIGLTKLAAQDLTFEVKKTDPRGREINMGMKSVVEFFRETYHREIAMPNKPCIEVGSKKNPSYLPIELCTICSDQHVRNNLTSDQMATLIRASASQQPRDRLKMISEAAKTIIDESTTYMKEFGIDVHERGKPLNLQARVLDAPTLQYGNNFTIKPFDGKWDMKRAQFYNCVELKNWVLVSFSNRAHDAILERLRQLLVEMGRQVGMRIAYPKKTAKMTSVSDDTIARVFEKAREECNNQLQLIMFILPNSSSLYEMIKYAGDVHYEIMTQCINENSLTKISPPFVMNILLKVNTKLGGTNVIFRNEVQKPEVLKDKRTMIVGIDFSHPGAGDNRSASVSSCVGSFDPEHVKYIACVRIQGRGKTEMIGEVREMFKELLYEYTKHNDNELPSKIIIYRDGVSEGQFQQVVTKEINGIKDACNLLCTGYDPKLTFIVVQKRHHTRLFPVNVKEGVGRSCNIPPGTVVDQKIVSPQDFDYFLCSHEGIQGTSRPTHYHVLHDENDLTADEAQKLTFYLTHIYVRCTRSISCPAAVAYAHLAAYRAQRHIIARGMANESSTDSSSTYSHDTNARPPRRHNRPNIDEMNKSIKVNETIKNVMYFC